MHHLFTTAPPQLEYFPHIHQQPLITTNYQQYYQSKWNSLQPIPQQYLWCLLIDISDAMLSIQSLYHLQHPHIKQYAIRVIHNHPSSQPYFQTHLPFSHYQLIYHPLITPMPLSKQPYYQLYLAPEQLQPTTSHHHNASVFSLGLLILNQMTVSDHNRTIYSTSSYSINQQILIEKINYAKHNYSKHIVSIIQQSLSINPESRPTIKSLHTLARNAFHKYKNISQISTTNNTSTNNIKNKHISIINNISRLKDKSILLTQPQHHQPQQQHQPHHHSQHHQHTTFKSPVYQEITQQNKQLRPQQMHSQIIQPPKQAANSLFKQHHVLLGKSIGKNPNKNLKKLKLQLCLCPLNVLKQHLNANGIHNDGNVYFGEIIENHRIGLGLEIFANGQYYFGEFNDDVFNGEGFYFWNKNQYFIGLFSNGQMVEGYLKTYKLQYQGQFKKGNKKRHGHGISWYLNNKVYEGQYHNGMRHGQGRLIEPIGDIYIGSFSHNRKHGIGKYITPSAIIHGKWFEDQMVEEIQIHYTNGDSFKGKVVDCQDKEGYGYYNYANGSNFQGIFSQNQPINGQLTYRNKQQYIGDIKSMKRDGKGTYYYQNGKIWKGIWRNNQKIEK